MFIIWSWIVGSALSWWGVVINSYFLTWLGIYYMVASVIIHVNELSMRNSSGEEAEKKIDAMVIFAALDVAVLLFALTLYLLGTF